MQGPYHPFKPLWRDAFLDALRECPVLTYAAKKAGIDRTTAYRHRQEDEEFAKAVAEAMEAGVDRAEQEAFCRAIDGWEEPVFYQGTQCGTILKKSDAMLSLVLKGRRKAVYAERTEITGADGAPIAHSDETTRAVRLAHLLELARLRKEAEDIG